MLTLATHLETGKEIFHKEAKQIKKLKKVTSSPAMKLCTTTEQTQLRLLPKNKSQSNLFVSRDYNLS